MVSDDGWEESVSSPFLGKAALPKPFRVRELGDLPHRWMVEAQSFVAILEEWKNRDYEEVQLVPGPGENWIPEPPERAAWFTCYGPLGGFNVTLETFRHETISLAGDIVTDPDVRDIGTARLFDLVDLIEAAYIEAEAGRGFQLDPIRLALKRAELACMAVGEVFDRRRWAVLDAAPDRVEGLAPIPEPLSAIELGNLGGRPKIHGREKKKLSKAAFETIEVLIAAGSSGLTEDELKTKSKHSDARGILRRLRDKDPDWASVIHMAEVPGGRYRAGD